MNGIVRLLAVGVLAALGAACQQSGGTAVGNTGQTSASDDRLAQALTAAVTEKQGEEYEPTAPFKTKLDELGLKLAERMLTRCIQAGSESSLQQCMRGRLLAGFDTNGMAERHCPQTSDMEADMNCITVGTLGHRVASKVGKDEGAAFDWSDPEKSATHASIQLMLAKIRECMSAGSASDPSECLVERLTKSLELTESDLDPCDVLRNEDYQYGQCIGEAFAYKFMSAGLARM